MNRSQSAFEVIPVQFEAEEANTACLIALGDPVVIIQLAAKNCAVMNTHSKKRLEANVAILVIDGSGDTIMTSFCSF